MSLPGIEERDHRKPDQVIPPPIGDDKDRHLGVRDGVNHDAGDWTRMGMSEKGELVELRDGGRALIRPIGPEDGDRLREGFESASSESSFLRFLSPMPRLSGAQLRYLTAIDHDRHEALIAVDPEGGQSVGLGTALLTALASRARAAGIVRFTGTINAQNTAIKRLVDKALGAHETRSVGSGAQEISVELGRS